MSSKLGLKIDELVLGDKVDLLSGDPYGWGTVVQITDETVKVVRPYVHIGDFTYTGGVLHYLGTEEITLIRGGERVVWVDQYTHEQMAKPGALK